MTEGKNCEHDIVDREVSVADGYCPLCMSDELSSLRSLAGRMAFCIEALYSAATPETCDDSLAIKVKDTMKDFKRLTNG